MTCHALSIMRVVPGPVPGRRTTVSACSSFAAARNIARDAETDPSTLEIVILGPKNDVEFRWQAPTARWTAARLVRPPITSPVERNPS